MNLKILENTIQTMLNKLSDAGYVTVKFMHMGKDVCWRPIVHRQTLLTEFDPDVISEAPKIPTLPADILIELSPKCFRDPQMANETIGEMMAYIESLNKDMEA